jgi:phosphoglycolate phosphatase-like HAD superfamily hydrolase
MTSFADDAWRTADAYLFDIDGTLLNTRDTIQYHAFHHAMENVFGIKTSIDGVPMHGNTDMGILRAVLQREGLALADIDPHLTEAITQMCAEVTGNAAGLQPEVCPSIPELLEKLDTANKLLGVASGNLQPIGWAKLERAGLRGWFAFGCFCHPLESREQIFEQGVDEAKRRLGPQATVCVVGDTPADIRAAKTVGIPVIAVATGIFPVDELRQLEPEACFLSGTELLEQI